MFRWQASRTRDGSEDVSLGWVEVSEFRARHTCVMAADETDGFDLMLSASYVTDKGLAVYPVDVLTLKKDLERSGVRVAFEHPAPQRAYKRLYSATSELIVPFVISLTASGVFFAIQVLAKLGPSKTVRISTTRTYKKGKVEATETLVYEGPASEAEAAVREWKRKDDDGTK